ncbi:very-long-chain (3R)-3-hydroxyacyl-CoA dehydratase [Paramyrothecium foliicola]|nr:very-long-chain (3R)-3-hydroxyacyl-CoA dehydratase [Paramyrothecium foliicola]
MATERATQHAQLIDTEAQSQPELAIESKCRDSDLEGSIAFFLRNGLDPRSKDICDNYAHRQFPGYKVAAVEAQGYCSYTLTIGEDQVLQFRPSRFKVGSQISDQARLVYGRLVPTSAYLGMIRGLPLVDGESDSDGCLHIYVQDRIQGVSLAVFREILTHRPTDEVKVLRRQLIEDVSEVFAVGLSMARHKPVGSQHQNNEQAKHCSPGYVWRTVDWRIALLKTLPASRVRRQIQLVQQRVGEIEDLPWCLTHGDMVPANIMVDPATGRLTGLIDWAEGEWLPFGIGLYGLEELLGEETSSQGFRYYDEHSELRQLFWVKLMEKSPCKSSRLEAVALARQFGIMLWRGLAFEDGRIDRVVEAGRDDVDIAKLHAFLEVDDGLGAYAGRSWVSERARRVWHFVRGCATSLGELWHRLLAQRRANMPAMSKIASMTSSSNAG